LISLFIGSDYNARTRRQILFQHRIDHLLLNDPLQLQADLKQALETRAINDREYALRQMIDSFFSSIPVQLASEWSQWESDRIREYLPLYRTLSSVDPTISYSNRWSFLAGTFFLHHLTGEEAALHEWWEKEKQTLQPHMIQSTSNLDLITKEITKLGTLTLCAEDSVHAALRARTIDQLMNEESLRPVFIQRNLFSQFKPPLITADELKTKGGDWARANPRDGHARAELAVRALDEERYDEAIDHWTVAIEQVPEKDNDSYTNFHLQRSIAFQKAERISEASASLDKMIDSRIAVALKPNIDARRKEIARHRLIEERNGAALIEKALDTLKKETGETEPWISLAWGYRVEGETRMEKQDHDAGFAYLSQSLFLFHSLEKWQSGMATHELDAIETLWRDARATITNGADAPTTLIPLGHTWRFLDTRQAPATDWTTDSAIASDWKEGAAPLGYGVFGEGDSAMKPATTINASSDENDKPITAWFVGTFPIEDPRKIENLHLQYLRDDGLLIYLNGEEILRDNLPEGEITPETQASKAISGEDEIRLHEISLPPNHLKTGQNRIAVELHQVGRSSSDLGFDLQLKTNVLSLEDLIKGIDQDEMKKRLGTDWFDLENLKTPDPKPSPSEPGKFSLEGIVPTVIDF
ncbi:MAG: hypothetical protein AAF514_16940, partial [Verrucomicrobiota bacterium]